MIELHCHDAKYMFQKFIRTICKLLEIYDTRNLYPTSDAERKHKAGKGKVITTVCTSCHRTAAQQALCESQTHDHIPENILVFQ